MKKNIKAVGFTVLGLFLIVIGLILIKINPELQSIMKALPYLCIGIGCGIFGDNLEEIINSMVLKKYLDEAKKIEIEQNDERNIIIANKAKAKAYDKIIYIYGVLIVAFGLMRVDIMVIIILVISYLFAVFSGIYYRAKYEKEM